MYFLKNKILHLFSRNLLLKGSGFLLPFSIVFINSGFQNYLIKQLYAANKITALKYLNL
jgi:hypothetical protein